MFYLIIGLFALAAIFGILILKNWLTSVHTSRMVVYLHGMFAAVALVLLLIYAFQSGTQGLLASIVLFVAAALGGFYMFARDLKGKFSPIWVASVHALLAVAGFVLLLIYVI